MDLGKAADRGAHVGPRLRAAHLVCGGIPPPDDWPGVTAVLEERREQVLDRLLATATPHAELHQGCVHDDAMDPGGRSGAALEAAQGAEGGDEGVLQRLARIFL